MSTLTNSAIAIALSVVTSGASGAPSFQGLGDLVGGTVTSKAYGISADGAVVVGEGSSTSGIEAFKWDAVNGITGLGDISGGTFVSKAYAVSADGSVIVGTGRSVSGTEAFRWDSVNGMVSIGASLFPDWAFGSDAFGVSADGSVIVGARYDSGPISEAYRWDSVNGFVGLSDFAGGDSFASAKGVSGDGAVCVGYGYPPVAYQVAAMWSTAGPPSVVAPLANQSDATGISQDGTTVVGWYDYFDFQLSINKRSAYRWTEGGGSVELDGASATDQCYANAVNANGTVIVGYRTQSSTQEAVLWRNGVAVEVLATVLTSEYGLDLTGWTLKTATGVSGDGLVIVGWGTNPSGQTEGWIANLRAPAPVCAGDVTGDGETNISDFNVLSLNFGQPVTPNTNGDLTGDGFVNIADFNILATDLGCGAD